MIGLVVASSNTGVTVRSVVNFLTVAALMAAVGLVAALGPARRALRIHRQKR